MKKIIAILLVLVLAGVGVFADDNDIADNNDTASLKLMTAVGGRYEIKVASGSVSGDTIAARLTSFGNLASVRSVIFTDSDLTETLNVSYLSNVKKQATVTVDASPMTSSTTGGAIGYNVTVGTADAIDVAKNASSAVSITLYDEGSNSNGMRINSQVFTLNMKSVDWVDAPAASDYTTTWTITLQTN
ncbi:MAG: hypothetical protein JJE17_12730 [Peptostreptococcaceae bacterium]|nr:hypothetical protein [Peptostreptococcaceae bacterium]